MDVPALIREAMETLGISQAGLARQLRRAQPTVSRWLLGQVQPDYESCLRLSMITGKPAGDVLRAAGLDPTLLPTSTTDTMSPIQRDVHARMARVQAACDAADGLPDDFVPTYLRAILDNTEEDIMATIRLVMSLRAAQRQDGHAAPFGRPNGSYLQEPETAVQPAERPPAGRRHVSSLPAHLTPRPQA